MLRSSHVWRCYSRHSATRLRARLPPFLHLSDLRAFSTETELFASSQPCTAVRVLLGDDSSFGSNVIISPGWTDQASVLASHPDFAVSQSADGVVEVTRGPAAPTEPSTLTLNIPQRCDLRVDLKIGAVNVRSKLEGDVSLHVEDGSVNVHKVRGELVELEAGGETAEVRVGSAIEAQRVKISASSIRAKRLAGTDVDLHAHGKPGIRVRSLYADTLRCVASACTDAGADAGAEAGAPPPGSVVVGVLQSLKRASVHASEAGAVVLQGAETQELALNVRDGPLDVHFDALPHTMVARLRSEGNGGVRVTVPGETEVKLELEGRTLRLPANVVHSGESGLPKDIDGGDNHKVITFSGLVATASGGEAARAQSVSPASSGKIRESDDAVAPKGLEPQIRVSAPASVIEFEAMSWIDLARRRAEAALDARDVENEEKQVRQNGGSVFDGVRRYSTRAVQTQRHDKYPDAHLRNLLGSVSTIVMVGLSPDPQRPSHFAARYLRNKGYRVIPINPAVAAKEGEVLGERAYAGLAELPTELRGGDCLLDIFRSPEAAWMDAQEGAQLGFTKIWLQLGIRDDLLASELEKDFPALTLVQDRCPKIEISRLDGQLGLHGFVGTPISSKKRTPVLPLGANFAVKCSSSTPVDTLKNLAPIFDGFDTRCVHAGAVVGETGSRATPIYQTTSYVFDDANQAARRFDLADFGHVYSRLGNPTLAVLEERIASLEGGAGGTATASGHSAQLLALYALLSPGDRIVASDKLYGGSVTQFGRTIKKFGWECDFVDVGDSAAVNAALSHPRAKALWCESLANPGGVVSDLEALASAASDVSVPLIVDNTLATPYLCRPIKHGASIVVHSTTKFLSGQGNAMGGVVVDSGTFDWYAAGKYPSLSEPDEAYHGLIFQETFGVAKALTMFLHAVALRDLGPTMAPLNAFLTLGGIETLSLRMERHCANAIAVASFLEGHPKVSWVSYAGLPTSEYHGLAERYLRAPGAVLTFGIKGGYDAGVQFVESCELFSHLANVGDARSLVLHPASTTHRQLSPDQRALAGAGDDTIRLSVGLETTADLIADLEASLSQS